MAIRNEVVRLILESDLSSVAARDAAAMAFLNRELHNLDGSASGAHLRIQGLSDRGLPALSRQASSTERQIDRLSGRVRILGELFAALGPAAVPLGGAGILGVAGLANQLGAAALAGGTAIVAFQGVGEALKAMNEARLEPTTENLAKMRQEMAQLGPEGRDLVRTLFELRDEWTSLQQAGAGGLLPGADDSLQILQSRLPDLERMLARIGRVTGNLLVEGSQALDSAEWDDFFDFLATDGAETLALLGRSVGNLARGAAELWMAFDPLSDFFSHGMLDASRSFAQWADDLERTEGFQDFIDYVRTTGPQVADTLGAFASALIQITQAAAPLGGPALQALESIARVVSVIADSPIGTPLLTAFAAMGALNRATATFQGVSNSTFGARGQGMLRSFAAGIVGVTSAQDRARMSAVQLADAERQRAAAFRQSAAALAGIGLVASGAADSLGVANTATLALTGAMIGGAPGAAIGGLVGGIMDLGAAMAPATDEVQRFIELTKAQAGGGLDSQIAAIRDQIKLLESDTSANFWLGSDQELFGIGTSKLSAAREELARLEHQRELEGIAARREADATRTHTMTIEANIAAVRARRDEALRAQSAETAYFGAILDAREAFKENGRTLDVTTRKGLENRQALERLVGTWNALSDTAKATPGAFREARDTLIDMAMKFGMTREEARAYAKQLQQVPEKVATEVQLDLAAARSGLEAFIRDASGRVITIRGSFIRPPGNPYGSFARADGGPIPMVPGATRGRDSVPVLAMPDEHMWTADEVRNAGGHDAVYALRQRFSSVPVQRMAAGGAVMKSTSTTYNYPASPPTSVAFSQELVDALAGAIYEAGFAAFQGRQHNVTAMRRG